ncbi:hypothetical protein [Nocardioides sp.]|uniref:WXG100 family type VII secretion target n=1 Tax=Nocardioides sp. TaxID=35761 RepID=UPI002CD7C0C3|nr:hypothetical protein [Nocardioides sp.]HXH78830.1 hypothetical protein [Nocardioides sp.]
MNKWSCHAGISKLIRLADEQHKSLQMIWDFTRDNGMYEGHWFSKGFMQLFEDDYDSATDDVFASMNQSSTGTRRLAERIGEARDLLEAADRQVETSLARLHEVNEAIQVPAVAKGYAGIINYGGMEAQPEHPPGTAVRGWMARPRTRSTQSAASCRSAITPTRSSTASPPMRSLTTSWRQTMTDVTIDLLDPASSLAATSPGGGNYIDALRDDCGYVIQGVDWVARQINPSWDLVALIFEPISGDFDGVQALAANWRATGHALGSLGANYGALSQAVPHVWEGRAADRAAGRMLKMGEAFDLQRETCEMMGEALDCMLTATRAVCETVAALLNLVDDAVVKLLASAWGLAREVISGGATVRKIIGLVDQTISLIKTLDTLVPKIIGVLGDLRRLFIALDAAFALGAAATNTGPGTKIDDVAGVGF